MKNNMHHVYFNLLFSLIITSFLFASGNGAALDAPLADNTYLTPGIAGPLVSIKRVTHEQKLFPMLTADYNCPALFETRPLPSSWPPPKHIPDVLRSAYTIGERVPVSEMYFAQKYAGGDALHGVWPYREVENYVSQTRTFLRGGRVRRLSRYGSKVTGDVATALSAWEKNIRGKHVSVVGTERPWLEGMLLGFGASNITTIEYGEVKSFHPQLKTLTPMAISSQLNAGNDSLLGVFDSVFSFSSLEHAGLGRYGDPLNPVGDVEAVAQISCLLKPGGIFFLGFGIGQDKIEWNAHRIYGKIRLPLVTTNYRLLEIIGDFQWGIADWRIQPILVLQNMFGCSDSIKECEKPERNRYAIDYSKRRKSGRK
mmetsp:Transcript_34916/g.85534  ORF Transcript_34916/g.85534 Transcript_34916/m.85534 type:complete len:369 (+) Transcript_34916:296-1402(+)|eukprot:CAMPEP_0197585548 /NCGR_PEP_ID=MMETSP1326-20131121/7808_1 /TAXON_ID=1155430 /ORGANISM="Genus nov. species nov., Strain RCC2288" /LENGTH=368 /DNA_ID=CAMNT_0043150069 /DNA_START=228 /DNA_END=1334 /DNA_ORIENTATION=-